MSNGYWILVVEPNDADRKLIELATLAITTEVEIVFVEKYAAFIATVGSRGSLPTMAFMDWFAGEGPVSCIETLSRLGFLGRLPMVAMTRQNPIEALEESSALGIGRFICKNPDAASFKQRVADAMVEFIPGARKIDATAA